MSKEVKEHIILEYIRTKGRTWFHKPLEGKDQYGQFFDPKYACEISKQSDGMWLVKYVDEYGTQPYPDEIVYNAEVMLYPSGIEFIKWRKEYEY